MTDLSDILLLGDPRLYKKCKPIDEEELESLQPHIEKMSNLVLAFRKQYGKGRAIAAPQIGLLKRLIVLNIDHPVAIINPQLEFPDSETFELWDDCMSFPNLLVYVKRYRRCNLCFQDIQWQDQTWYLSDDMSELMQHEFDHLDGILATQRAIDQKSFKFINFQI